MSTAALDSIWNQILALGMTEANWDWLQDKITMQRQIITVDNSRQKAEKYLQQHCSATECAELMATDFLNKPYPPFCNQTEEEIMREIEEAEKEGYLSEEESMKWLNSLASMPTIGRPYKQINGHHYYTMPSKKKADIIYRFDDETLYIADVIFYYSKK